jgi:hypothetical protein
MNERVALEKGLGLKSKSTKTFLVLVYGDKTN